MTEEIKRRGRPTKNHLQDEHHFHASEDFEQPSAPPATCALVEPAAEAQAGSAQPVQSETATASEPAALLEEGSVENTAVNVSPSEDIEEVESLPSQMKNAADEVTYIIPPVEQKNHYLTELSHENLNGWFLLPDDEAPHVEKLPPRNGTPVLVSDRTESDGVIVFWKKKPVLLPILRSVGLKLGFGQIFRQVYRLISSRNIGVGDMRDV